MLRPLTLLAVMAIAATAVGLWGGTAYAWRMVCEAETSVATDDTSPRLDDERPAPVLPFGHDVCIAGVSDDPACWPTDRLPARGGHIHLGSSQSFMAVPTVPLPRGPSAGLFRDPAATMALDDGHQRRLERPPRAV